MRSFILFAALLISDALRGSGHLSGFYPDTVIDFLGGVIGIAFVMDVSEWVVRLVRKG